jgi:hypothetical protein
MRVASRLVVAEAAAGTLVVASRPPSARTSTSAASNVTETVPSRSVRNTRAPAAANRSSVLRAGWPYGLPVPADAMAIAGRTASTNACVEAVLLP